MAALALLAPASANAGGLPPLHEAATEYAQRADPAPATRCRDGEALDLAVATAPGDIETSFDAAAGRLRVRYRMAFNQVTEGWNWHPEATPGRDDYYVFKYVPLQSTAEERPGYRGEDKIGTPQDFAVRWRYDYFFAFDNPYDFYARGSDDDAGFAADFAVTAAADAQRLAAGDLRMALRVRLAPPCTRASTTFWKATYGRPVDFTLRKRYLLGRLDEVLFWDATTRRVLARLTAKR